jgi:hypothetical protein
LHGEWWVGNRKCFKERDAKVTHGRTRAFVDFDFVLNRI